MTEHACDGWDSCPNHPRVTLADAIARVTPCSCSVQRARAEQAEAKVARVEALLGRGDTRTLDDIDEPAVLLDDLRAALRDVRTDGR